MTRSMKFSGAVLLFVTAIGVFGVATSSAQGNGQSEVRIGMAIAPVPLTLHRKNRALVGEGSYYVNGISDCVGCHTADGGEYLGGGRPFGPVLSRNLTPDASGNPAGLTYEQFHDVMRLGTDFKGLPPGGPLIVMPWPAYQHGTDRFLKAIYEYLSAIPCVEGGPGTAPNRC